MDGHPFVSLATVQLPHRGRLLPSAWCPDKDLLVVVTRVGSSDRLSLWKMQGAKKWEVDVTTDSSAKDEIVGITWSPDGQTIAVAHHPPKITLHSIQDGRLERSVAIVEELMMLGKTFHLTGIWWFKVQREDTTNEIPDIFKRGGDITGSAHSVLRSQPLLDPLQDESHPLGAADLFAFNGAPTRAATKSGLPSVILGWPTLPSDPLAASMRPAKLGGDQARPGEELDEIDDSNDNSILAVSDDYGHIYCYLDGSYPIGAIAHVFEGSAVSLHKDDEYLWMHSRTTYSRTTTFTPAVYEMPLLGQRILRDMARTSSSVRELVWYAMRVVRDLRETWFGTETQSGARALGPQWIRNLENRQTNKFGVEEPRAMLDLTSLLTTGRASESLSDYLGSGEQMSERAIQKWESTVIDALVKLRNTSERQVAPACQRLYILLEEMQGWSQLSRYTPFAVQTPDVIAAMELANRAIVVSSWLAATARREMGRFKEFMVWLKYETARTATAPDNANQPQPKHDILEVNDYLMSGLVVSPIDKWFMGPVPQFTQQDLGVPSDKEDLKSAIQRAKSAISEPGSIGWQTNIKHKDLSHLDRNLESLIQELATRCSRIFGTASQAAGRSAVLVSGPRRPPPRPPGVRPSAVVAPDVLVDEWTVPAPQNQPHAFVQHLAMYAAQAEEPKYLCVVRSVNSRNGCGSTLSFDVAILECCIVHDEDSTPVEVLNVRFFDDKLLVLVCRAPSTGHTLIATVNYADIPYQTIEQRGYINDLAREGLATDLAKRRREGQLPSTPMPVVQSRKLIGCEQGKVSLVVNGRVGRRVACVMDEAGTNMEIFDIEGEEEDEEAGANPEYADTHRVLDARIWCGGCGRKTLAARLITPGLVTACQIAEMHDCCTTICTRPPLLGGPAVWKRAKLRSADHGGASAGNA